MTKLRLLLPILIMIFAAACGGDDGEASLPTLIELGESALATEAAVVAEAPEAPSRATLPPSWTPDPTVPDPTETATLTFTPSMTITDTPSPTATATASETMPPSALGELIQLALEATVLPSEYQPPPGESGGGVATSEEPGISAPITPSSSVQCQYLPPGGFGQALLRDASLLDQLGCPVGAPPVTASLTSASQRFERGAMAWINDTPGVIYILYQDGTFQRINDTYDPTNDPVSSGANPPTGLQEPVRGFGKVWRTVGGVRDQLGWATGSEAGGTAVVQDFARGRMLYLPSRGDILVIKYGSSPAQGTWQALAGQF